MTNIPGRYTISGGEVVMSLGTGTNVGKSTCDAKDNFNKTLTASNVTKTFVVKRLDSVFRPDAPLVLCFDGQDGNACFERTNKQ